MHLIERRTLGFHAHVGMLMVIFAGLVVAAGFLAWIHARKERRRNEMVALAGYVDSD